MEYKLNLQNVRLEHKLTQENIAMKLNITRSVYAKYESGYELIPLKHLISFANHFNISIDYILGLTSEKIHIPSNNDYSIITKRLKEFRKEQKLTQEKLAKLLNTNKSVICNYEKGRYMIATPFLYTICKKYHISADYLLGRTDTPKYL